MKKSLYENTLPNVVDLEKAFISTVLYEPTLLTEVVDSLDPKDFYNTTYSHIWRATQMLWKAGVQPDMISISDKVRNLEPTEVHVSSTLAECLADFGRSMNINMYIEKIKNCSLLRQVILMAGAFSEKAREKESSADFILTEMEKELLKISDGGTEKRSPDVPDILNEVRQDMVTLKENKQKLLKTGFPTIDKVTGGLIPTQIWILGAYTGTGKSFMVNQIMLNILEQGGNVGLISTEMDRKLVVTRLLGNLGKLDPLAIITDTLTPAETDQMVAAEKFLSNHRQQLAIYDNVYTTSEIRLKAKKRKVHKGLDVLIVDFIQNLKGSENIYERMSNAAVELQQLAQELKICIIVVSQVSQGAASWQKKEAIEYKGAGEIATIADVALWITKDKDNPNIRNVALRKVRWGKPSYAVLSMVFPGGKVTDTQIPPKELVESVDEDTVDVSKDGGLGL